MANPARFDSEVSAPRILVDEAAAPATPPAGQVVLYVTTAHVLHAKDSTGADRTIGAASAALRIFMQANFR